MVNSILLVISDVALGASFVALVDSDRGGEAAMVTAVAFHEPMSLYMMLQSVHNTRIETPEFTMKLKKLLEDMDTQLSELQQIKIITDNGQVVAVQGSY